MKVYDNVLKIESVKDFDGDVIFKEDWCIRMTEPYGIIVHNGNTSFPQYYRYYDIDSHGCGIWNLISKEEFNKELIKNISEHERVINELREELES